MDQILILQAKIIEDWRKATDRSESETLAVAVLGLNPLSENSRVFYLLRIAMRSNFIEKIHSLTSSSISRFSHSLGNPILGLFSDRSLMFLD